MRPLMLLLTTATLTLATLTGVPTQAAPATQPATRPAAIQPAAAAPDPTKPSLEQARAALQKVQDLLAGKPGIGTQQAPGKGIDRRPAGGDLTMALRDLAMSQNELPADERDDAERILARPTDGVYGDVDGYENPEKAKRICSAGVCVHYIEKRHDSYHGVAAGPTNDVDPQNGHPDYVDQVLADASKVHTTYVDGGYRKPLGDGKKGGDSRPDIYLANLGPAKIFGYCTSDDPRAADWAEHRGAYAYCVLDNDYTNKEYGGGDPTDLMRVTAAHEYFHAVQFGYDIAEDVWFMEATATWAEDEVFPNINDNMFFLRGGPMTHPKRSMDAPDANWYGAWIYFRYLSERYPASTGAMPTIVRRMWERADAWSGADGPDMYSLQAMRATVKGYGGSWNDVFRRFTDANRRPGLFYEDAALYPSSPLHGRFTMTFERKTRTPGFQLDHLAAATYRFSPEADMKRGWKLKVTVDGNPPSQGGAAIAVIMRADGTRKRVPFNFDGSGVRTKWMTFGTSNVKWIEVIVVNASTRMRCWRDRRFSCQGSPRDDNRDQRIKASAVRP